MTDAGVVLGRLPGALIGGGLKLDVDAARDAFEALGRDLGLSAEEAAAGILEIAASNQVQGIRKVTTTRGLDPGDYAMIAFGGAGGLFAADVADFLGIKVAVSPPNPGNLSAFGLHVCDIKRDYVRTLVRQQSIASVDELEVSWADLERLGCDEIAAEGVAREAIALERSADVRYVGEGHEVLVAIPAGLAGAAAVDRMWSAFHTGSTTAPSGSTTRAVRTSRSSACACRRSDACTDPSCERSSRERTMWVSRGRAMSTGAAVAGYPARSGAGRACPAASPCRGPGIVEEYGSTLVVPEGWTLRNDDHGNLILEKGGMKRSNGQGRRAAARSDRTRGHCRDDPNRRA